MFSALWNYLFTWGAVVDQDVRTRDLRASLAEQGIDLEGLSLDPEHCILSGGVLIQVLSDLRWADGDVDLFCHASVFADVKERFLRNHPKFKFTYRSESVESDYVECPSTGCTQSRDDSASNEHGGRVQVYCPFNYRMDERVKIVEGFGDAAGNQFQIIVVDDGVDLVKDIVGGFDLSICKNSFDGAAWTVGDAEGLATHSFSIDHPGIRTVLQVWAQPNPLQSMTYEQRIKALTKTFGGMHEVFPHQRFIKHPSRQQPYATTCGSLMYMARLATRIQKYSERGCTLRGGLSWGGSIIDTDKDNGWPQVSRLVAQFEMPASCQGLYTEWIKAMQECKYVMKKQK